MTILVDPPAPAPQPTDYETVAHMAHAITNAVNTAVVGRRDTLHTATVAVLAGGHVLVEDVPGVGKTLFAQSLAKAIGGSLSRVQGTNDLLPGDVLGFLSPTADRAGFEFRRGPIFSNVVLFDELNRTTPRTQSALFEVMEEACVSVDGVTYDVPHPMILLATQNPTDQIGTHALGEGAADRFLIALSLGRASADEEVAIVTGRAGRSAAHAVPTVCQPEHILWARQLVGRVHLSDEVGRYLVDIVRATREHPGVRLGASTRGAVALAAMARAQAATEGRHFVTPGDVYRHAVPVLAHRMRCADSAAAAEVVGQCVAAVQPPR
jgi:MoxR-like ATPase